MNLESFMIVAAIIFAIGLYGALVKRNAIVVLMSIELMFNGVNITAVALSRYVLPARLALEPDLATNEVAQFLLTGQVFAIFIITVAAAEVALGLAIILAIYRNRGSVLVSDVNLMKK
jgi:NADH:ubiquinone oxidoreductase subunit K